MWPWRSCTRFSTWIDSFYPFGYASGVASRVPTPELLSLLERHGLTIQQFWMRGCKSGQYLEARSSIITELHVSGMPWKRMREITGLSLGAIQRLTKAMWNDLSRKNRQDNARRIGQAWKGKKRPGQLERQWASGCFDHLRGRVRPPEECARLKAGWTSKARSGLGLRIRELWATSVFREKLMVFHTQPEERERRSLLQTQRMLDTPWTYGRGHGCWLSSPKCRGGQLFWVRSSFERRMVELLNADQEVLEFEYEPRHRIGIYTILPDFVVVYRDRIVLVEVKASWALQLPTEDRVQLRLQRSRNLALRHGWDFAIWTEKELGLIKPRQLRGAS